MKKTKAALSVAGIAACVTVAALAFPAAELPEARTETVARRDLFATVIGSGQLQPKRKVDISADISGRVVELAVQEGALVREGDLLLRIDPTRYQAAVYRAEAALAQAMASSEQVRANYLQSMASMQRVDEIERGSGLIASAELEQARTQATALEAQLRATQHSVDQARASLAEARDALEKATITAPMSGRVTRVNIQEGEIAVIGTMNNPGSLLLTIAELSEMEARVVVNETDLPQIAVGDSATVRVDAFPGDVFVGRVARIANSGLYGGQAQRSTSFQVTIALDRTSRPLHPDLSATAEIVTDRRAGVLTVPLLALTVQDRDGQTVKQRVPADDPRSQAAGRRGAPPRTRGVEGVFVVEEGMARFKPVVSGVVGDQYVEIRSGLREGDVVVAGTYQVIRNLRDGDELDSGDAAARTAGRKPHPSRR